MLVAVSLSAIAAIPASAQDFNAAPNYGTVNLAAGFTPDPQVIAVRSGGSLNAQSLSASCRGFISAGARRPPHLRSRLLSADHLGRVRTPIRRSSSTARTAAGIATTTAASGVNPSLRFNGPRAGRYEIWVGTYANASLQPAQLHISEVGSQ